MLYWSSWCASRWQQSICHWIINSSDSLKNPDSSDNQTSREWDTDSFIKVIISLFCSDSYIFVRTSSKWHVILFRQSCLEWMNEAFIRAFNCVLLCHPKRLQSRGSLSSTTTSLLQIRGRITSQLCFCFIFNEVPDRVSKKLGPLFTSFYHIIVSKQGTLRRGFSKILKLKDDAAWRYWIRQLCHATQVWVTVFITWSLLICLLLQIVERYWVCMHFWLSNIHNY